MEMSSFSSGIISSSTISNVSTFSCIIKSSSSTTYSSSSTLTYIAALPNQLDEGVNDIWVPLRVNSPSPDNNSALYISGGTGSGQAAKKIIDYVGSSKTVTLESAFSPAPDGDSTYILAPQITVSGDGSTTATAYANVSSGAINYINMIAVGAGYSQAFVTISANSSHGSGATAEAYIAPPGGHGSDPVKELAAHNIIMNVQLSGSESDTFPTVNDFREVGILKNPTLSANGGQANSASYDQTTQLTLTSVSGSGRYSVDEVITGGTSTATGRVVSFSNTNFFF